MGPIFCTEIKILNSGSHDISQKLRQTKCLLFHFWMIRLIKIPILPNCQMPNGFLWYRYLTINLVIQKWRSKNFVFSQFSLATCFFREWEKIFYTYFRPIGGFFSESIDALVISSNAWTFYFPELEFLEVLTYKDVLASQIVAILPVQFEDILNF